VSQSKPYERMYKIILHSADATYDDKTTYVFRDVNIPFDEIKGNCRIFVSSFHFIDQTDTPLNPYYINLEELSQPLTYDSRTKNQSKTLITLAGLQFEVPTPDFSASIQDLSLFRQRTLTITFKSAGNSDNSDLKTAKGKCIPWTMTLGIIQTE
jgi:hypothetical protein